MVCGWMTRTGVGWQEGRLISTRTNFTPQIADRRFQFGTNFADLDELLKPTFSETLVLLIHVWKHGKGKEKTYFDRID